MIDALFSALPPLQFKAVQWISAEYKEIVVAKTIVAKNDMTLAWKRFCQACKPRIHLFFYSPDIYITESCSNHCYGRTLQNKEQSALTITVHAVTIDKHFMPNNGFSSKDIDHIDQDCLPEIVGYTLLPELNRKIENLYRHVENISVIFEKSSIDNGSSIHVCFRALAQCFWYNVNDHLFRDFFHFDKSPDTNRVDSINQRKPSLFQRKRSFNQYYRGMYQGLSAGFRLLSPSFSKQHEQHH